MHFRKIAQAVSHGAAMSGANGSLRALIVERYDYLIEHLRRRLRSTELAQDALHDTYLRLDAGRELTAIVNPVGFLLQAATNAAKDRQRSERRRASSFEIDSVLLDVADDAPDPARAAEAKSDYQRIEKAIAELPERRRAIMLISMQEKLTPKEIAARFRLSRRTIDTELNLAREHCVRVLLNKSQKK
jgi:RNA polymerase sigma-70 factor (ECF subfamily)